MTSIKPKLTAAITTIAILAPSAGAQAASYRTQHPDRHYASTTTQRHYTNHHALRPASRFRRYNRSWS